MNILVKVPKQRKCSASIDVLSYSDGLSMLSFGDLETPQTDVEVEFTYLQLKDLKEVVANAIKDLKKGYEEYKKAQEKAISRRGREHHGSC